MRKRSDITQLLLAICVGLALSPVCHADEPSQEYKLKAAFIYNFARFIEWGPEAFENADSPLVIAVVGKDPFNGALEQAVSGKKVGSRKVEIRHFDLADNIGRCHILFVAVTDSDSINRILQKVENLPVLTVGERESFDSDGGALRFFAEDHKIRFEIDTDVTDRAGLKISSKLLKLARIHKK